MCGSTQSHITEEGEKIARKIALERIKNDRNFEQTINSIDNIIISSLKRTKETAIAMFPNKICDGENNQGTFCFNSRKAFDEINFGVYEMMPKSKLPEEIINLWKYNPSELTFPNVILKLYHEQNNGKIRVSIFHNITNRTLLKTNF